MEKEEHWTIYEGVIFGVDAMVQYKPKTYKGYLKFNTTKQEEIYWNGWLIPYVKKNVRDKLLKDLDVKNAEIWDSDHIEDFKKYVKEKPDKEGFYCVGWGLCWNEYARTDTRIIRLNK